MGTKVQIKSEKFTPFGGIFFVINLFKHQAVPHVDAFLGLRSSLVGYQYSEALLAMMCNFFSGGVRTEDIDVLKSKLPQRPGFRICSPDTVLRCLSELAVEDTVYTCSTGKEYRFNTAELLNGLLVYIAIKSGLFIRDREYDLDFDHEFLKSETWEALPTYKVFNGYGPGCAVLTDVRTGNDVIAGIIRNFYEQTLRNHKLRAFGIQAKTRMKAFVNRVVTVVAKWTRGGRRDILTLHTPDKAYVAFYADYG